MQNSADLIAQFEGYRDSPYWDVTAYRAGFGSDTTTLPDGTVVPISQGMTVTREDSLRDLQRRIEGEFRPSARNAIGAEAYNALTPAQQAVLDSLAYNYGAGAWGKGLRGVATAVQSPGLDDDISAIRALAGHNDGVNRKRRLREAEIYGGAAMDAPSISGYQAPETPGNALAGFEPSQIDPVALIEASQRQTPKMQAPRTQQQPVYSNVMQTNALAGYVPQYDRTPYLSQRLMRG